MGNIQAPQVGQRANGKAMDSAKENWHHMLI